VYSAEGSTASFITFLSLLLLNYLFHLRACKRMLSPSLSVEAITRMYLPNYFTLEHITASKVTMQLAKG
jgi:hypothetical protein